MLCVYGHYKYFNSVTVGTVSIRQILMYKDGPRTERVLTFTALGQILVVRI